MNEISLPNLILKPLEYLPWCKGFNFTETYHHDHVSTGWIVGLLCVGLNRVNPWLALAVYLGAATYHVFIKELWLDRHKNAGPGGKEQRAVDLTTRAYGMVMGGIWIIS